VYCGLVNGSCSPCIATIRVKETCVSYEEEDTCVPYEEEDTCVLWTCEGHLLAVFVLYMHLLEEEDTCFYERMSLGFAGELLAKGGGEREEGPGP